MDEPVQISRTIFGKTTYQNVINTKFTQLVSSDSSTATPAVDVKTFFVNYNELFYDIPSSGSYSGSLGYTHLDLVNRSSDYIGISFQDLQAEIIQLRTDNVALRQQIFALTQQTGSTTQ